jgi:hypothetical protein
MYQKIGINTNDGSGRSFMCQFKSQGQFDKFSALYENYPGYKIFSFDIWDESKKSFGLPLVSADYKGFSKVVNALQAEKRTDNRTGFVQLGKDLRL